MNKTITKPFHMRDFKAMASKGRLNFDMPIQRKGNIWDDPRKSLLVHSLLTNFPIPPLYSTGNGDKLSFIDGKQRLTSLLSYLNDEFPLSSTTPSVKGVEIAGKKFSELPNDLRVKLMEATLDVSTLQNPTYEELEELFFRLNNGVTLKSIESTRVLLGSQNMKIVEEISQHPFFANKSRISSKRYTEQETVLHLLMIVSDNGTGFSSKEIKTYVQSIRGKKIPTETVEIIKKGLDYLDKAFNEKKKYLKKLHLPMIFMTGLKAMEMDIKPEDFGTWVDGFFIDIEKDSVYNVACQSGSAKRDSVQKRLSEIFKAFYEGFNLQVKAEA